MKVKELTLTLTGMLRLRGAGGQGHKQCKQHLIPTWGNKQVITKTDRQKKMRQENK
jgi:hypothetical protein